MINNYLFGKFEAGLLTRLGIAGIIELIKNSYKICRQHLDGVRQNASFGDIVFIVGPSNPGILGQLQIDLETSTASLNSKPGRLRTD